MCKKKYWLDLSIEGCSARECCHKRSQFNLTTVHITSVIHSFGVELVFQAKVGKIALTKCPLLLSFTTLLEWHLKLFFCFLNQKEGVKGILADILNCLTKINKSQSSGTVKRSPDRMKNIVMPSITIS